MKSIFCAVCGMIINDKNYNINEEGIPQKNSEEKILYCPFCGASQEYFVGNKNEIYKCGKEELDNSTITILDHAVKLEIFNGDFYKKASEMAISEKLKKMFTSLAKIEYTHAKIHFNLGGFKELPKLKELDYNKYNTDNLLLELAWKREKHAVEYYKKYSGNVLSNSICKVFEALSSVEEDHVILNKDEIK